MQRASSYLPCAFPRYSLFLCLYRAIPVCVVRTPLRRVHKTDERSIYDKKEKGWKWKLLKPINELLHNSVEHRGVLFGTISWICANPAEHYKKHLNCSEDQHSVTYRLIYTLKTHDGAHFTRDFLKAYHRISIKQSSICLGNVTYTCHCDKRLPSKLEAQDKLEAWTLLRRNP